MNRKTAAQEQRAEEKRQEFQTKKEQEKAKKKSLWGAPAAATSPPKSDGAAATASDEPAGNGAANVVSANAWEAASFSDDARKNKFMKLMGAGKKKLAALKSRITKKRVKTRSRNYAGT